VSSISDWLKLLEYEPIHRMLWRQGQPILHLSPAGQREERARRRDTHAYISLHVTK